jgi:hypothetical protein
MSTLSAPSEVNAPPQTAPEGLTTPHATFLAQADVAELWQKALELGGGSKDWKQPTVYWIPVFYDLGDGQRVMGHYFRTFVVESNGDVRVEEAVALYYPKQQMRAEPDVARCVLLHEFLHSVWFRRAVSSTKFVREHHADEHGWIDSVLPGECSHGVQHEG